MFLTGRTDFTCRWEKTTPPVIKRVDEPFPSPLLNQRGNVLLLVDCLTLPFARSHWENTMISEEQMDILMTKTREKHEILYSI